MTSTAAYRYQHSTQYTITITITDHTKVLDRLRISGVCEVAQVVQVVQVVVKG